MIKSEKGQGTRIILLMPMISTKIEELHDILKNVKTPVQTVH